MKFVYNKADKFCNMVFLGNEETATKNGFIQISDNDYEKLCNRELCWKNGKLVKYTKTADELAEEEKQAKYNRIAELKRLLSASDYKAIKYAEGLISAEDYAETKATRQAWRDEINALESDLSEGGAQ